ncbi:MAG TPA: vitamin K epoxide reductase family protein [Terriglobales bacterium]|nr:vitamin K epoxide reductase family protein [Terriglobales bacterium]
MTPLTRRLMLAIAVLALAGIGVSVVSLAHHYSKSANSFCDLGQTFNCDIVNRSEYSSILGVPVALIGVAGYLALFALATVYRDGQQARALIFGGALSGLGFALYLTYIEGFVLGAWCILCLSSLLVILTITILSALAWRAPASSSG